MPTLPRPALVHASRPARRLALALAVRPALLFVLALCFTSALAADRVLLFTKTAGTRENNVVASRTPLKAFYEGKGLIVDTSENAALFSDTGLAKYKAIVFLKTTGDFLNDTQQAAFEKWFKAGGGAQIIHAALDAEPNWAFYGKMIGGAYFQSLPGDSTTKHTLVVADSADAASRPVLAAHPDGRWPRTDEIYGFRANPRSATNPSMHILMTVDESTYKNGHAGTDHPMSWSCAYMGGRAWTTAIGHTTDSYAPKPSSPNSDSLFLYHLWGGMEYILGRDVVPVANPVARKKTVAVPKEGFLTSGARFGDGLEKDARGREAGAEIR
ncbi:MAG: ThuA domain-containing protein [Fibrobacteres bacterium]|jgi:type 1 glutamine amidotransferase|nr:ThuA domain-containing protein [Fibrobacterota bacterium]